MKNNNAKQKQYRFTVCLLERNAKGELTGRKKEFSSDSGYKIWEFYNRNCGGKGGSKSSNRRKTSSAGKSSSTDIKKWAAEASKHAKEN